ncbi:MAG: peptide-methionine (S)-S-oxide reductase MsrA [Pseudomonadota bacterium]
MFLLDRLHAKLKLPDAQNRLPGRDEALDPGKWHHVNSEALKGPYPEGSETIQLGMGCFWGAERIFWQTPGVHVTAVGYAGGTTINPTYQETCTGLTGHTEIVLVVFDPTKVSRERILQLFWESHDPTQGMRQGNDVGTQYRSAIYCESDEQLAAAKASAETYQKALSAAGRGQITTEIATDKTFYFAEEYHQQYLAKNPGGYCGIGGTGVSCPVAPQSA